MPGRAPDVWPRSVAASQEFGLSAAAGRNCAGPVLVDTSIWVDHFRRGDPALQTLLERGEAECHPFVIGELACGWLRRRGEILTLFQRLPQIPEASHGEVVVFVEQHRLMGRGIGWIDAHLLASAALAKAPLWSRDRRLSEIARMLGLYAEP